MQTLAHEVQTHKERIHNKKRQETPYIAGSLPQNT